MTTRPMRVTALLAVVLAVSALAVACGSPAGPPAATTTTIAGSTTTAGPTTTVAPTTTTIPALTCAPGTLVANPNPIPVGTIPAAGFLMKTIETCFNSAASIDKPTYIYQCYRGGADPLFDPISSCSNLSEFRSNPNASPTQTNPYTVFYGTETTGDESWGCFKPGDTAPAGITKYTTCYLRFVPNQVLNTTDHLFVPITFS